MLNNQNKKQYIMSLLDAMYKTKTWIAAEKAVYFLLPSQVEFLIDIHHISDRYNQFVVIQEDNEYALKSFFSYPTHITFDLSFSSKINNEDFNLLIEIIQTSAQKHYDYGYWHKNEYLSAEEIKNTLLWIIGITTMIKELNKEK